eukprot:6204034-Pleurochrysis_carterae.AAC.4
MATRAMLFVTACSGPAVAALLHPFSMAKPGAAQKSGTSIVGDSMLAALQWVLCSTVLTWQGLKST